MIRANSLFALALLLGFVAVGYAFKQESPSGGPQMEAAAQRFLKALTPEQRTVATLDYSAAQRLDWHFIPKNERKGLQLRDMNEQQRQLARNLLASCLSEVGYHKATTIMNLEQILEKLEGETGPLPPGLPAVLLHHLWHARRGQVGPEHRRPPPVAQLRGGRWPHCGAHAGLLRRQPCRGPQQRGRGPRARHADSGPGRTAGL